MCRKQLPVWQEFHQGLSGKGTELLAVAMDAQGPERATPYLELAHATFQCAVDANNVLGEVFNFKAIPNGVFIDEEGVIRYVRLGGFDIRKPEFARLVQLWAQGTSPEELVDAPPGDHDLSIKHPEALESFRRGLELYRRGETEGALVEWRQGMALEPDNYVIHKQLWAVEHPERFYDGDIDTDWQREQRELGR